MKGAAQRWIVAGIAGLALGFAAQVAPAADVTDNDRVYRNFTRETATVSENQIRLEVRGLQEQDEENTRLNLLGLRLKNLYPGRTPESLTGGIIDLVGSYGLAKNAEVGFIVPGYIETIKFKDGSRRSSQDVGDLELYGKFKRDVAEHCAVGAGVELTVPNGPKNKGFSTGETSVNPVVSTRYQRGPFGVGMNVGYQFFAGDAPDVFNYGAEVIVRGSDLYAIRTEIVGRVFNQGVRNHDLTILPGIDFNLSENVTIRPTGLANGTDTALDWGVGLGVAVKFAAPQLAAAPAPPPPPPAPPPPPPPPAKEKIILRGVNFDFDKSAIRADARPILDSAVDTLKEHGSIAISVEGHTDSKGTDEYNQALSVRRATAVRDYLAGHGIDGSRMTTAGFGESRPVASNDTDEGRAQNRRVELQVAP